MNNNSKNELNSSIKQALLDLEKVATVDANPEATKVLKAVKTLLKLLDRYGSVINEADKIFNQHRYNDKKLHFAKVKNYKKQQIIFNLTARESQILFYMITFMSQANSIMIRQTELARDLKSSKRDIVTALKGLEEKCCIVKVKQEKNMGTIYMVNPDIATVGKHECYSTYQEITSDEQLNKFLLKTNKLSADVINLDYTHITSDNTPITVRTNLKITKDE